MSKAEKAVRSTVLTNDAVAKVCFIASWISIHGQAKRLLYVYAEKNLITITKL